MKKNKIKKSAYTSIVNNGQSHQSTFDELRPISNISADELAEEVSRIPSRMKSESQKTLVFIFIGLLSLIILIRIFGVLALTIDMKLNISLIIIAVLLGIILPGIGIYGALRNKVDLYKTVGIFLSLSVFRSFTEKNSEVNEWTFIVLIPFVAAIILAFYIPTKLKTSFTKEVIKSDQDGITNTSMMYNFENSRSLINSDLLDDSSRI